MSRKLQVLVIEDLSPERKERWERARAEVQGLCELKLVSPAGPREMGRSLTGNDTSRLGQFDVVMIHERDLDGTEVAVGQARIPLIVYGGGSTSVRVNPVELKADFIPVDDLFAGLKPFVQEGSVDSDAFLRLAGADPALEQRLISDHTSGTEDAPGEASGGYRHGTGTKKLSLDDERARHVAIVDRITRFQPRSSDYGFILTSPKEFNSYDFTIADRVVILAEIAWEGRPRSSFHGFSLAAKLVEWGRYNESLAIAFLSTQPRETFVYGKRWARLFSRLPFVEFQRLDSKRSRWPTGFREARPPSRLDSVNIRQNHVARPAISVIYHDFQSCLTPGATLTKAQVNRLFSDLNAVNAPYREYERRKALLELEEENVEAAQSTLDDMLSRLSTYAISRTGGDGKGGERVARYRVLLVEDDSGQRSALSTSLDEYFDITAVATSREALTELEKQERQYHAVIADWQLYDNDGVTWQDMQGYDVLEEAARMDVPRVLITLTSLDRDSMNPIIREARARLKPFSKHELGNNRRWSYGAFADYVVDLIQDELKRYSAGPKGSIWDRHGMKECFLAAVSEGRLEDLLTKVRQKADEVHEYYSNITSKYSSTPVTSEFGISLVSRNASNKCDRLEDWLVLRWVVIRLHFENEWLDQDIQAKMFDTDPHSEGIQDRLRKTFSKLAMPRARGGPKKRFLRHENDWLSALDLD